MTVADILKMDIFRNVSVCAGSNGLSRSVSGITTTEDSDLLQWLKGGEILLISLNGSSETFASADYLRQLASKEVAALMIKLRPGSPGIPDEIIRQGNLLSVPVILLPSDLRFIDAISSVIALILKHKNKHYIQVQNTLTKLAVSGAKEQEILDYLTEYIPAYITLSDSNGTINVSSQSLEFRFDNPIADRIRLPVMCMGKVTGYLEAIANQYLNETLETHLKTASNLFSVLALKKYYVAEIEQKYISDFLRDLFENRLDEQTISDKSKGYGWDRPGSYIVVIMELYSEKSLTKIPEALVELTSFLSEQNYFFYIHEPCLRILLREPQSDYSDPVAKVSQMLSNMNEYVSKKYRTLSLFAGISSLTHKVTEIPRKVKEANDALQFGHAFNNRIVKYNDMGVLRLLASQSNITDFEQIIPPSVQKLAAYDKANNTQYLETLDSLLGNNLNLSKTAKQLFIHYKTMLHRMDRICEIAEISLDDRQTRLDVELGVKLYMMLPK